MPQSLEAGLEEVAKPLPRAEGEDTFHNLADRPVSEERPASRTLSTQSRSSTRLDDTVRNPFVGIPAVAEGTSVRILGDTGRATEESPGTKVLGFDQ